MKRKPYKQRVLWEVWPEQWGTKKEWKVQYPAGIQSFSTKRAAVKDALNNRIADSLRPRKEQMGASSGKRRIRQNAWGNWYGYEGKRRVKAFAETPEYSMEQNAERWRDGLE